MLKIYHNDGSVQVLKDFHPSFHQGGSVQDLVHDLTNGAKNIRYTWDNTGIPQVERKSDKNKAVPNSKRKKK